MQFALWSPIAVAVGGLVEIVPSLVVKSNIPAISAVKPYTPLELEGRDIYLREGCYVCHSQMIRPFRAETGRYGEYCKAGEFVYDHPFQFGSRRIGPGLHRVEGKYPDIWHYRHMADPRATSPASLMPSYPWRLTSRLDTGSDIALEAAHVILVRSHLPGVVEALTTARRTFRVIRQNLGLSISYNALAVPVAMASLVIPLLAAKGMPASSLLVVANALRLRLADLHDSPREAHGGCEETV